MSTDNRFYVQRFLGGRVTGTVSGAAYFRAREHARWAVDNGYSERVVVRGWLGDGRQGDCLSPVVFDYAK